MTNGANHTRSAALLGTDEGMRDLLSNLTADEFSSLISALRIITCCNTPHSMQLANKDLCHTLYAAADRVAQDHADLRASRADRMGRRMHAAYQGAHA